MRALRLDPFSGISGDMFNGALVDLVDGGEELRGLPAQLGLDRSEIRLGWVDRCALKARKFDVLLDGRSYEEMEEEIVKAYSRKGVDIIF